MAEAPKTWILTGSPERFAATRGHGAAPLPHRPPSAAGTPA
ncbi:MAG TPA: hypothetical protein VHF51_04320 [Solirubrobacteraceae bacterium]|nr:hypothetical protein [Solirubrobacteraceae bacterium]